MQANRLKNKFRGHEIALTFGATSNDAYNLFRYSVTCLKFFNSLQLLATRISNV